MNPVNMSGLGGALIRGAAGYERGKINDRNDAYLAAQQAQTMRGWERTNQEQDLMSAPGQAGESDVDRLERIATLADQGGRGDLAGKLRGESKSLQQKTAQNHIANGARAIMVGQFDTAVQHLNAAGTLGKIHSIQQKEPGIYGVTWIDDAGQPQVTDINYQMLAALAADPGELDRWISSAGAAQDKAEKDRADRELRERIQLERERHNKATEAFAAWRAKNGGRGGGSGRLTDYQIKLKWATSPEGMKEFGGDMGRAQQWAANPSGVQQEANARLRFAGQGAMGYYTAEEVINMVNAFQKYSFPSVRPGGTEPPAQAPPPTTRPRLADMGTKPVAGKPGVFADAKGRHFREVGDRVEQWSPSANKWVDITDRLK